MTHLDGQVAIIAARQHGAFHRRQLGRPSRRTSAAAPAGRHRALGAGPRHVYLVPGSADTWHRRLWIGLLEAGPDTVLSRRSAAVLTGLPGFKPGPVDVLKREAHEERMRSCELHVSSWLPPNHRTNIDGFPTTSVARTLFDLAALGTPARASSGPAVPAPRPCRAGGRRCAGPRPHHARSARRGRRHARQAGAARHPAHARDPRRPRRRPHRHRERARGPLHGRRRRRRAPALRHANAPSAATNLVGRVDFLYEAEHVVIECDGRRHHFGKVDAERDRWRDLELSAAGWLVIRVTWWQLVHQPERFTAHLRRRAGPTTRACAPK